MRYRLKTLGRLSLHPAEAGSDAVLSGSKSLAVLAYVAAVPGHEVERSHLASLLWPGSDRKRSRRSLRQAIYYLSQKAGDGLLLSDDGRVAANPRRLHVDLWAFEEALEEEDWDRAVRLYDGPFLGGYSVDGAREFEGWREARNERIWSGLKAAYYRIVDEAVDAGDPERAVRFGREYVELNPLDETAQRTLIRAHLAAGDRVGAFRTYQEYRALLREELGESPGEELQRRIGELRDELFGSPMARVPERPVPDLSAEASKLELTATGDGGAASRAAAGDGPPEDDGEDAARGTSRPGRRGRAAAPLEGAPAGSVLRWVALGLLAGLGLGSGVYAALFAPGSTTGGGDRAGAEPASHGWSGATGRLRVQTRSSQWVDMTVSDGRLQVRGTTPPPLVLWAPDGGKRMVQRSTPDGVDVAVLDASGDTLRVLATGADEQPVAWSPDARRFAIWRGERLDGGRRLARRLAVVDVETGVERTLDSLDLIRPAAADWHPRGPTLAFRAAGTGGEVDLFLADADLESVRRLTSTGAVEGAPCWAPSGDRLAYAAREGGDGDLWVMTADGGEREQVTFGASDDRSPVWLSDRHLAFLSDREGGTDVWLMDLQTREIRRLTARGDLQRIRIDGRSRDPRPVHRIRIAGPDGTVSPGQRLPLDAEVRLVDGAPVPARGLRLRWSSSDPGVVRVESDSSARVVGTGDARLVVTAGGWVADTLEVDSRPLALRPVGGPLLSEDWTGGIGPGRWTTFGEPRPVLVEVGETGAARPAAVGSAALPDRAFVNNGDPNYASGAVTRRSFSARGGLTVEFQAALPFTGSLWQSAQVGLIPDPPRSEDGPFRALTRGLGLALGGEGPPTVSVQFREIVHHEAFPTESPEAWHRYALQLEADGRVSLVVDDTLRWRSAEPVARDLLDEELHLYLGGRSHDTRLKVGRVRLWQGARFGPRTGRRRLAATRP